MGVSTPTVATVVSNRAEELSSDSRTSLALVSEYGEEFGPIDDSAPADVRITATEISQTMTQYSYDLPALAACFVCVRENAIDIPDDVTLQYCEGYTATGATSPSRSRWVTLDNYVLDVGDDDSDDSVHARVAPPADAEYFGVGIPADRALQLYEDHCVPLAPHAVTHLE